MGSVTAPLMPIVKVFLLGLFVNIGLRLASKFRLASSKSYTIPRLELMSCLLLFKLIVTVKEVVESKIDLSGVFCWSDSKVALWWIRQQSKKWIVWVQNRATDIRHYTSAFQWSHVLSHLNVSDISTRSISLQKLIESSWYNGPSILLHSVSVWPNKYACSSHLSEEKEWLYVSLVNNIHSVGRGIGAVVDCQKNRKLGKLLRMTGHVLCFIKNICLK